MVEMSWNRSSALPIKKEEYEFWMLSRVKVKNVTSNLKTDQEA